MVLHEDNKCLLEPLDIVRLNVRELSLLAKWPDDRRPSRVAAKEAPHAHYFSSINEGVGNVFRFCLFYSLGKSLSKSMHNKEARMVRPESYYINHVEIFKND